MITQKEIDILVPVKVGNGHCGRCHLRNNKDCLAFNKKLESYQYEIEGDKEPRTIFYRLSECYAGEMIAQKRRS